MSCQGHDDNADDCHRRAVFECGDLERDESKRESVARDRHPTLAACSPLTLRVLPTCADKNSKEQFIKKLQICMKTYDYKDESKDVKAKVSIMCKVKLFGRNSNSNLSENENEGDRDNLTKISRGSALTYDRTFDLCRLSVSTPSPSCKACSKTRKTWCR